MVQKILRLAVKREKVNGVLDEIQKANLTNGEIVALALWLINHVAQSCEDRASAEHLLKSVSDTFAQAKIIPNPFYGQDDSNIPTC